MEFLIILLGLGFLALPIVALILAITANGKAGSLEAQVRSLAGSVARLTDELHALRSGAVTPLAEAKPSMPATAQAPAIAETTSPEEAEPATPEPVSDGMGREVPMPPRRPRRDLESMIGGRWSVILGGLATALGAVLLVRATIEAGLLGPAARIIAAGLFSAGLLGGGEYLRRRDKLFALPAFPNADIPAILTAAGAVGAFATVFAAHSLYGFVGVAAAFVLLTVVGLATLALSAVHGPGLAALGVLGSYATPLMVSSDEPNLYVLAAHVLVVTGSVMGIAVIRNWLWLAFAGVAGSIAWTLIAALSNQPESGVAGLVLLAGSAGMFAATFGQGQHGQPAGIAPQFDKTPWDRPAIIAFAALTAALLFQTIANQLLPLPVTGIFVSLIVAASAVAWPPLAPVALVSSAIVLVTIAALDLQLAFDAGLDRVGDIAKGLVPPDTAKYVRNAAFAGFPATLLLLWGAWRAAQTAPRIAAWLASSAGLISFTGMVVAYLRVSPFETNRSFGVAALALAFAFAGLVESFTRRRPDDLTAGAPAAFAVTSISLLCFGLAVTLDTGWLPLAFALAAAGIAWIYGERPLPVMPWLALAAATISAGSIYVNSPFSAETIGTTPLFNQLILLAGLPGVAITGGGEWLRRKEAGAAAPIVVALGFAVLGLFVALQIRHALNGGALTADAPGLLEMATQAIAALGFSMGLQRIATMTRAPVYHRLTTLAGGISAAVIALGLIVFNNPLFDAPQMGENPVFNVLLPGYLLPALMAAAVAIQARPVRPRWYTLGFAALSGLLFFFWITLTIRHAWKGEQMEIWHSASESEVWSYSVAWLLLGIALLVAGHFLKSQPIRFASAALIMLTVTKVFLVDMSALTGAMRAFSFIGLGLSLLAIGRFYQRILLPARDVGSAGDGPDLPGTNGT